MIKENLERVKKSIEECARKANRSPNEISLVAVTKNHSISEIKELIDLGLNDFGENKVQEALPKIEELPAQINWHFIGRIQKNKVSKIVGRFKLIHSVDSLEIARKISDESKEKNLVTSILLQVNISKEESKAGLSREEWLKHLDEVLRLPNLEVKGLMTMAPLTDDEEIIRKTFRGLKEFQVRLSNEGIKFPILSMGMSHDYKIAIEEGATHLRIGTLLFSQEAKC